MDGDEPCRGTRPPEPAIAAEVNLKEIIPAVFPRLMLFGHSLPLSRLSRICYGKRPVFLGKNLPFQYRLIGGTEINPGGSDICGKGYGHKQHDDDAFHKATSLLPDVF